MTTPFRVTVHALPAPVLHVQVRGLENRVHPERPQLGQIPLRVYGVERRGQGLQFMVRGLGFRIWG